MSSIRVIDSLPLSMRVLRLDAVCAEKTRITILRILFSLFLLSVFGTGILYFGRYALAPRLNAKTFQILEVLPVHQAAGAALVVFGFLLPFLLLEFYYRSYKKPAPFLAIDDTQYFASSEALRIFLGARLLSLKPVVFSDLLFVFAQTHFMEFVLLRLGIGGEAFVECIGASRSIVETHPEQFLEAVGASAMKKKSHILRAGNVLEALMSFDKVFAKRGPSFRVDPDARISDCLCRGNVRRSQCPDDLDLRPL